MLAGIGVEDEVHRKDGGRQLTTLHGSDSIFAVFQPTTHLTEDNPSDSQKQGPRERCSQWIVCFSVSTTVHVGKRLNPTFSLSAHVQTCTLARIVPPSSRNSVASTPPSTRWSSIARRRRRGPAALRAKLGPSERRRMACRPEAVDPTESYLRKAKKCNMLECLAICSNLQIFILRYHFVCV